MKTPRANLEHREFTTKQLKIIDGMIWDALKGLINPLAATMLRMDALDGRKDADKYIKKLEEEYFKK